MKIATFNVNGIRSRLHQLETFTKKEKPDIIALQEIKCVDDAFPLKEINAMGYHAEIFGQKGHYGVALLSVKPPERVLKGFPDDGEESQKRLITGYFRGTDAEEIVVINGYFPQGECRDHPTKFPAKQKFYSDLLNFLKTSFKTDQQLIITGDMNVAPHDLDVGIGDQNARRWLKTGKCCFLPEERQWLQQIIDWGTTDLFRHLNPQQKDCLSWFDYRTRGFDDNPRRGLRIDLILGTEKVKSRCKNSGIDYQIRGMEKPSDHAPVWIEIT